MAKNLTRRRFLRTSVAQGALLAEGWPARKAVVHRLQGATAEPAKTYSAGDQIGLALIGAGGRGQDDTQTALRVPGVRLVAAADVIYGEEGEIQVDRFSQKPREVIVKAYGRRGRTEPIAYRSFPMREYGRPVPEFVERFGLAYKAELAAFVECCKSNQPFPVSQGDGVRAQQVIRAGMQSVVRPAPITTSSHNPLGPKEGA
jgi:hypothetical protein